MLNRLPFLFLVLGGLLLLSGCSTRGDDGRRYMGPAQPPQHCYRSLADVDCYDRPLPAGERTPVAEPR